MTGIDVLAVILLVQPDAEQVFYRVEANDALSTVAFGCAKLLLAVVVLAVLISLLVQALRDLGVRSRFQRSWVLSWLMSREKAYAESKYDLDADLPKDPRKLAWSAQDEILGLGKRASIFALSSGQLCGQLSSRVQLLFNDNRTSYLMRLLDFERRSDGNKGGDEKAGPAKGDTEKSSNQKESTTEDSEARRLDRIERSIDDLQLYLDQRWKTFDYVLGVFFAVILIALSIAWAERNGVQIRSTPFTLYAFVSVIASLLVPQVRPLIERLTRPR